SDHDVQIRFLPGHQILHGPSPFSVIIEDSAGVPENFDLKLYYNGISFGDHFIAKAERTYLDSYGQRVKLSISNLRLLADRDNKIKAIYKRSASSSPVIVDFLPPKCSAFEYGRHLASVTEFQAPHDYVQLINQHAMQKNLNPNFVAGLIAQESGFDP